MKLLLVELWGLGDIVMMSAVLRPLLSAQVAITVMCKPASMELLRPSFPQLDFILFDAPWTVFKGKYRLLRWPWRHLWRAIEASRRGKFDAAASVRNDPRDHLLMLLSGATHRIGFPRKGSGVLLTDSLPVLSIRDHRVDQWRQIGAALGQVFLSKEKVPSADPMVEDSDSQPYLNARAYSPLESNRSELHVDPLNPGGALKVGLHCGARIPVRRWPEKSFEKIIRLLREDFDFHLALFPDLDGYGRGLLPLADSCHEHLSLPEMVAELATCDLLICNDSGPGHIAAALNRPVLAIFGPTNPDWFRPYGERNQVVIRDICPLRPCFDYCHFPEPICLTQLGPDEVWPEIRAWFQQQLPSRGSNLSTHPPR